MADTKIMPDLTALATPIVTVHENYYILEYKNKHVAHRATLVYSLQLTSISMHLPSCRLSGLIKSFKQTSNFFFTSTLNNLYIYVHEHLRGWI